MSLSSLVSATSSVVRLSEAAVAAAEEAMTAARLATIHANSALAAARLALDLETRIGRDSLDRPTVTTSCQTCIKERERVEKMERVEEVVEVKKVEEDDNLKKFLTPGGDENIIDVDDEDDEIEDNQDEDDNNESTDENVIESPERPERVQRTPEYCRNCKLLKGKCLHGKFVLNVLKVRVPVILLGEGWHSYWRGRRQRQDQVESQQLQLLQAHPRRNVLLQILLYRHSEGREGEAGSLL